MDGGDVSECGNEVEFPEVDEGSDACLLRDVLHRRSLDVLDHRGGTSCDGDDIYGEVYLDVRDDDDSSCGGSFCGPLDGDLLLHRRTYSP